MLKWLGKFFGKGSDSSNATNSTTTSGQSDFPSHDESDPTAKTAALPAVYRKPKIMLVDMPDSCAEKLRSCGFNVSRGSFGQAFMFKPEPAKYAPVTVRFDLPNRTEQEIVIVQLMAPQLRTAQPEDLSGYSPNAFVSASKGIVNPIPLAMAQVREDFDRILKNGGVFVLFACPKVDETYFDASRYSGEEARLNNWGLLSCLHNVNVEPMNGNEMTAVGTVPQLAKLLTKYLPGSEYSCRFSVGIDLRDRSMPLVQNKYKEQVSAFIQPDKGQGFIFLLPQIKNQADFLCQLVREILPLLAPQLFPHFEGHKWTRRPEYELPEVVERQAQLETLRQKFLVASEQIEKQIAEIRTERGYLHNLLTAQGDELVDAVQKALVLAGCNNVINKDDKVEDTTKENLQEDLWIDDRSPLLLVEIKGIGGKPSEDDCNAVSKYVLRRVKELKRTDIRGLVFINHQRMIPALERDNEHAFFQQNIDDAVFSENALMTTWDLYRLLRGKQKWNWPDWAITDLFYKDGRVGDIPANYERIGVVEKTAPKLGVCGIKLELRIASTDRLAYVTDQDFVECNIKSLELERNEATACEPGQLPGVKLDSVPKEKTVIYRVVIDRPGFDIKE